MKQYTPRPRVISVRRNGESFEDEAPTVPLFRPDPMATPSPRPEPPLVILIRPSWIDMPLLRLAWAFIRAAIAASPAIFIVAALWRYTHG